MRPPTLWRLAGTTGTFTPDSDCTWLEWEMCAGGGGGAGTDTASFIPNTQYGQRGGDSFCFMKAPVQSMMACAPSGGAVFYFDDPPNFYPGGEVVFLDNIPVGYSVSPLTPYWTMPGLADNPNTCQLCPYALTPPFNPAWGPPFVQIPMTVTPTFQNPVVSVIRFYYGTQGGGPGGLIGDQGTPLGYWGDTSPGPDGVIQAQGFQGGCGNASYMMGGGGSVNGYGGGSCNVYQTDGNQGADGCGAGGAGGSPAAGNSWGGCNGASGARMQGRMLNPGVPIFCCAGMGGAGGVKTGSGYNGGRGGHGSISIWQH